SLVERTDRDERAGIVAQPRLVETAVLEARESRSVELDPPAGGRLRESRLTLSVGHERRGRESCAELLWPRFGAEDAQPDGEREDSGCSSAGEDEVTRAPDAATAPMPLSLDPRSQGGGRLDLDRGIPRE